MPPGLWTCTVSPLSEKDCCSCVQGRSYKCQDIQCLNWSRIINVFELMLHVYFTGTAGDSLYYHNGMKFTTQDVDNDLNEGVRWSHSNCAQERYGGWWFNDCSEANLNGAYLRGHNNQKWKGICWYRFKEDIILTKSPK
jgi:ficolin